MRLQVPSVEVYAKRMIDSSSPLLAKALTLQKARRYDEAESLYRRILADESGNWRATLMLGILAAQTDREQLAIELLSDATERDPMSFDAAKWLAAVLCFCNRFDEAEPYAVRASRLHPHDYDALLKLATVYFGQARFENSVTTFQRAIQLEPKTLDAYFGLSTSLLKLGEPNLARKVLRDAVRIRPEPDTLLKLGEVCLACERPLETIECCNQILEAFPENIDALRLLVRAYRSAHLEQLEDQALDRLQRLQPDDHLTQTLSGRRFQNLGKFKEAEDCFRRSIELNPDQGIAYFGVTSGRKLSRSDQDLISRMEDVVVRSTINQDEKAHLHFALGKAYDNLEEFGKAIYHFDQGNRLMRELRMGTKRYDRTEASNKIDRIQEIFTKDLIESFQSSTSKNSTPKPIFIAGIMRSGTTLMEQIISRHPLIGAAGELGFWRQIENHCINYSSGALDLSLIRKKADVYLKKLSQTASGFENVTDKNPANRMVYGLLQIALPGSKIIHMRRNPVDVAISIYTTLIRTNAPFMGSREDIVFELNEHARLTRHWKSVLPSDNFLEIDYENLIGNREATTRKILDFCGLDWDPNCLTPERNDRTVVTPSFWQVRQPVYSASVSRWKNYEPWLGPFADLLPKND